MNAADLSEPLTVRLEGGRSYPIVFRSLTDVPELLAGTGLRQGKCLVITDEQVATRYAGMLSDALLASGWTPRIVSLPAGETTKSPEHLQHIYDVALSWNIDRKTPLLALGGGVIGDLAGYAAATLLRGVPFVQLPTTLIAQVDSAIGGKTGINHATGKNLIGAFHQPVLVCSDLNTLLTLPDREWTSGLAEVVKHALIRDPELFHFLEDYRSAILSRDPSLLHELVSRAVRIKVDVVSQDEREAGLRAILNFGHTFGHAIEKVAGYGQFTHGEAVALGMQAALCLSHRFHPDFPLDRASALVRLIPIAGSPAGLRLEDLTRAMQVDKKVEAGALQFVLLDRIGNAYVSSQVSRDDLSAAWEYVRSLYK